jgi:hypothetical protein
MIPTEEQFLTDTINNLKVGAQAFLEQSESLDENSQDFVMFQAMAGALESFVEHLQARLNVIIDV